LPLIALLETLLQMRGDAFLFVHVRQRPEPLIAENIGAWAGMMRGTFFSSQIIEEA
jgi:hypothetical protein